VPPEHKVRGSNPFRRATTYRGRKSATTQLIRRRKEKICSVGRIFAGRFGLVLRDAGNTGVLRFAVRGGRERPPKPGGPGPQRGPKRGVAPALLSALPASTFGVFSSRIWFVRWGVAFGRNREPSREPCREPTYDRFSGELRVPRRSLLAASGMGTRKTVRKTARKTDFRAVFQSNCCLLGMFYRDRAHCRSRPIRSSLILAW
jgi:hypothetical protein